MDENNKDDIIEVEKVTDNEEQKVEQVNQVEENKKEQQQEVKNAEVVNEKTKNQVEEEKDRKGYCIASLVLGIVSLVLLFVSYISVPCAITAIIFGAIGIKSKNKGGNRRISNRYNKLFNRSINSNFHSNIRAITYI